MSWLQNTTFYAQLVAEEDNEGSFVAELCAQHETKHLALQDRNCFWASALIYLTLQLETYTIQCQVGYFLFFLCR